MSVILEGSKYKTTETGMSHQIPIPFWPHYNLLDEKFWSHVEFESGPPIFITPIEFTLDKIVIISDNGIVRQRYKSAFGYEG